MARCERSWSERLVGTLLGVTLFLTLTIPHASSASVHRQTGEPDRWPHVRAAIQDPLASDADVVDAARLDLARAPGGERAAPAAFARYLVSATTTSGERLDARRNARILRLFLSQSGPGAASFWSQFSLATLQQIAGDERHVAETLARALDRAREERIAPPVIAKVTGIMGHAQQAGGMPERARRTFERLRGDPIELDHAVVHLGELALSSDGVAAGIEIWLGHPAGLTVGVTIVVDEADALWSRDPEQSYRLVDAAVARLRASSRGEKRDPALDAALARLSARARHNAIEVPTEDHALGAVRAHAK